MRPEWVFHGRRGALVSFPILSTRPVADDSTWEQRSILRQGQRDVQHRAAALHLVRSVVLRLSRSRADAFT